MEKSITLASCSNVCNAASDIEGDVMFCRAYDTVTGERKHGDSLAFIVDFDDTATFRLALALTSEVGADLAFKMTNDMGVHSADRKKIIFFRGWATK